MTSPTGETRTKLEAAAFRRLVSHLRERSDVPNIELMLLAGFCRNCLADWYLAEADARGVALDKGGAREVIYGMKYSEWKQNQPPATEDQLERLSAQRAEKK